MSEVQRTRPDHVDSFMYMMSRRRISEFAAEPYDYYPEGLRWANVTLGGLTSHDAVLDLGGSSGQFALDARAAVGIDPHIYVVDPDDEPYNLYLPVRWPDPVGFDFIKGYGEDIPLPNNAVAVSMAHNVLFRAKDMYKMLGELVRVTRPGGLILVSTNARDHAPFRHNFERIVADYVSIEMGVFNDPLRPPAHGCYMEDFPDLIKDIPGLRQIYFHPHKTYSVITRDRLPYYRDAIYFSANQLSDSARTRSVWRKVVDSDVIPYVEAHIARQEARGRRPNGFPPHFPDPIHRGLFVLRNIKP